ncbi:hypothetical protein PM082_014993 [Marasmius tenuissimus]|nr:hypothetical protein PM082_014993 [Marasmius tenuissimus]
MGIRLPFVFLLSLHSWKSIRCFSITGIPDQVTQLQPVTFTWFRETSDPTDFLLAKTASGVDVAGPIGSINVANAETRGIMTANFIDSGRILFVAGYDLRQVQYLTIVEGGTPRPSPFFLDNHAITISPQAVSQQTSSTARPSPSPGGGFQDQGPQTSMISNKSSPTPSRSPSLNPSTSGTAIANSVTSGAWVLFVT